MGNLTLQPGATNVSVTLRIVDSTDGTPETGVVYNSAGMDLWYRREGAAKVSITEATLSALTDAHSDGGFLAISDGWYRLDLPDAACAAGVGGVQVGGTVTGMVVFAPYIQLESAGAALVEHYGLDHLVGASVSGADVTDNSIIAKMVSASATADWDDFVNTTDSLQAIRDAGAQMLTAYEIFIPNSIDLADTATVRLSIHVINALDDLPSTAEITPGTISIDRKAAGGASWTAVVTDAACSESAGLVYYDAVFDSGTGYAQGDSIRVTFKGQSVVVDTNTYEVTPPGGVITQTQIRETSATIGTAVLAAAASDPIDANIEQINTVSVVGDGSGTPFTV